MAVGRTQREAVSGGAGRGGRAAAADARVLALLARHEASLMRVARQWSLCQDDALDAFQRGLEIYIKRLDTVEPATEAAWLKVVIRHEALAIRRARGDCVVPDIELDEVVPSIERSVEEQVLSGDRVSRSAEALRALKPDEARALMLKAHGLSYDEIGRRCGWTYTKVNRAITEGRRRFMDAYAALEAGIECDRFAPILQALAQGTATSAQLVEVRPHLRRCSACRATVRDLHLSGLRRIRVLVPLPAVVVPLRWLRERFGRGGGAADRPDPRAAGDVHLTPWHPPHPTPRIGDVVLPQADGGVPERMATVGRVKQHVASLLHRLNSSDLAAGIHIATSTGGGRIATLGAMVGLCLSGAAAGTVCVVTGIVHGPFGLFEEHHGAVVHAEHRAPRPAHGGSTPSGPTLSADRVMVQAAATPTPTPTPRPRLRTAQPAEKAPREVAAIHSRSHDGTHASRSTAPSEFSAEPGQAPQGASPVAPQPEEFGVERTPGSSSTTSAGVSPTAPSDSQTPRSNPVEEEFGP